MNRPDPWGRRDGAAPHASPRGPAHDGHDGRPQRPPQDRPRAQAPARDPADVQGLFLPCAAGVEALLAEEVQRLCPRAHVLSRRGGVALPRGREAEAMTLNLHSRLAQRVLWTVAHAPYRDEEDIYALGRSVDWSAWISPRETLRVDVSAQRSPLQSIKFAALVIKDAVCDQQRQQFGERSDVETRWPDLPLLLHLGPEEATLYVDTSGEALFKRGWRQDQGEAPLKETLAAAMLAAAGWQGRAQDGPLLDPVCGSGTIAIEAAQLACGIAPGLQRRFAFERLLPFREARAAESWRTLRGEAVAAVHAPAVQVYAGDVSFRMSDFALRNAQRAGVLGTASTGGRAALEIKTADALQRMPPAAAGTLMLNPPYGERIDPKGTGSLRREDGAPAAGYGRPDPRAARRSAAERLGWDAASREDEAYGGSLPPPAVRAAREAFEGGGSAEDFFARLAAHWKRHYAGWTAWLLSPDPQLARALRLKESRRVPMWNGPIECRLMRFDLVAGSARAAREPAPDADAPPTEA